MYKATGKSAHYLPRKGSYSTVPHRNGRVDVLPPSAKPQLFEDFELRRNAILEKLSSAKLRQDAMNEARDQSPIKQEYLQYHAAASKNCMAGRAPPEKSKVLQDFEARYAELRSEVRSLQGDLGAFKADRKRNLHGAFVNVAHDMLDTATYERLMTEAKRRCRQ